MKIVCAKEKLLEGINTVQRAISTKTTLPILEGILVEANQKLKLIGNDLEIAIECTVESDILTKGSIVVNSKIFGDIIRKMPDGDVLIEAQDGSIVYIECMNTHFKIKGLSSSGFPALPVVDKLNEFNIESGIFKGMVKQTVFAASTDESLPIFTGVLVECKGQNLSIIAADRAVRMAYRRNHIKKYDNEFKVIIPARTLNEISRMIQNDETNLHLNIGSNHIIFKFADCIVISRVIDGEYINYRSVMREEYETKIIVQRNTLLSSIERAMLISFADKKYPVVFNINNEELIISCKTENGELLDEIDIDMDGKQMKIAFNPQYFIECLRVIEDDYIEVLFATNLGPGMVKPVDGDKYAYLIGAIRI